MYRKYFLLCMVFILTLSCNKEFVNECQVTNLKVDPISCNSDSTYSLKLNFDYFNVNNKYFDVYVRNKQHVGYFLLDSLPITIPNFKISGKEYDLIEVCINDAPGCCEVIEYLPPKCKDEKCTISNLIVDTGECTSDSTYNVTIDFDASHSTNDYFDIFVRGNKNIGYYKVSDLPITIPNFKRSGKEEDFIKICINDNPDCCKEIEFLPPECEVEKCMITDLRVEAGACTSDSTYSITLNFDANHPTQSTFDVFVRGNQNIGYYKLSDLPITIPNFKVSGKDYDFIKVCINDNADCCEAIEFLTKDCK